jgi:tetratricopeptide (TPR) repeat protein
MLALTLRIAAGGGLTDSLRRDLESRRPQLSPAEACLLAQLLQSAGDQAAAVIVLRDVSARAPALGSTLLVRLHAAAKEFSEAVRIQQTLVESPGGRKAANVQRLVELCANASRFTEALRWTEEWKKLAHGSTSPWLKEASLLADSGRLSEASRRLQQASRLWPEDEEVTSRLAAAQAAAGAPMDAQRSWLRLYERAESTSGKLRWLQPLMQNAADANLIDDLAAEFERRRAQNRQSPVPLLALAEIEGRRGNQRRRLELLWEAARLGQGDVVLLTRAAEAAVAEGFLELAASMLADAAKLDKSDALSQQRVVLLLQLGRDAEASGILTSLAAGIVAEDAAELAVALSQEGHVTAAAGFLQKVSSRFPAHYRLGWLSACLLDDADDVPAALEAYLHLARTNFAPMPDALARPVEFKDSLQETEPVLTPLPSDDSKPHPGADGENLAVYQAMEARPGLIERQSPSRTQSLHRVPGPPWQLRGWAAARAVELASWNGPEALAEVRNTLLKSGVRGAIFADVILSQQYVSLWPGYVAPDFASHPDDTGWILRLVLGAAPRQTDESNPLMQPEAGEPGFRPRRHAASLLAWRHFQKSDVPYAIDEALLLADSPVAEERAAAAEALRMVEARETPGPLLAGVLAHLTDAVVTQNPAPGSLAEKLSGRLASWYAAAPPGPNETRSAICGCSNLLTELIRRRFWI